MTQTFIVPLLMFLINALTPFSTEVLKELLAENDNAYLNK